MAALGCALAAWHGSAATFTGTTSNPVSDWQAGSVAVDATPAVAVISAAGAQPGSFGSGCVVIRYTGTLDARVRMYLRPTDIGGTGLAPYLTLRVADGTGTDPSCADFAADRTLYNPAGLTDTTKTVPGFAAASHDYATGVSDWAATPGAERTYRIDWRLQDDNAAATRTADLTFTWEAQPA